MPSVLEFLEKAERNERLSDTLSLLPERYTDWEITVLFYSALHYVNAFLQQQGLEAPHHFARFKMVASLTNFAKEYENLSQKSVNARYKMDQFSVVEVDAVKSGEFLAVKEGVISLLSRQQ